MLELEERVIFSHGSLLLASVKWESAGARFACVCLGVSPAG